MGEVIDLLEDVVYGVLPEVCGQTHDGDLVWGQGFACLVLFFALYQVLVESLHR